MAFDRELGGRVDGRIGERTRPKRVHVRLRITGPGRLFGTTTRTVEATVTDLSVLGAALYVPGRPSVRRGQELELLHDLGVGTVVVRRVEPWAGGVLCGVEFVELDAAVRDLVYRLAASEGVQSDWRWTTAR